MAWRQRGTGRRRRQKGWRSARRSELRPYLTRIFGAALIVFPTLFAAIPPFLLVTVTTSVVLSYPSALHNASCVLLLPPRLCLLTVYSLASRPVAALRPPRADAGSASGRRSARHATPPAPTIVKGVSCCAAARRVRRRRWRAAAALWRTSTWQRRAELRRTGACGVAIAVAARALGTKMLEPTKVRFPTQKPPRTLISPALSGSIAPGLKRSQVVLL